MKVNPRNLPPELLSLRRWVCFRLKDKGKTFPDGTPKRDKIPMNPRPDERGRYHEAKSNDPKTWGTCAEALQALPHFDGIGIQLGYVEEWSAYLAGHDEDDCFLPGGKITPEIAARILPTYTERSLSGKGIKSLCKVDRPIPEDGRKKGGNTELYSGGRFFALTGDRLPDSPSTVNSCELDFHELHARVFPPAPTESNAQRSATKPVSSEDADVLARVCRNAKWADCYAGNFEGHYPDHSTADSALYFALYAVTDKNASIRERADQAERLYVAAGFIGAISGRARGRT